MKMTREQHEKMNELCLRAKDLQAALEAFRTQISATMDSLDDEAENAEDVYMEFDEVDSRASRAVACMDEIQDWYRIL